jgi:hypothetical protein
MKRSFTLPREQVLATDRTALMHDVTDRTGSGDEAASILRSLDRLGSDASIHHYEMTPTAIRRSHPGVPPVTWSVRAVRE